MSFPDRPASKEAGFDFLAFALLVAILVFAPLIKGGNRPLPLLVLELAALPLLAFSFYRLAFLHQLSKGFLIALGALALLPLLHLLPVPAAAWAMLPGREIYAQLLGDLFGEGALGFRSLSVVPRATEAAWLAMLPPLAVFLFAIGLPEQRLKQAVFVFLCIAAFQAVLGLMQYGSGSYAVFWSSPELMVKSGTGTYTNYNHLAGLLEMALPIALGMLAYHSHSVNKQTRRYHRKGLRGQLAKLISFEAGVNRTLIFGAISLAILLGLVFTRSRTGIALGMLGLLLAALLFARRLGGRVNGITTVLGVLGLILAIEIGLAPVMQRFGFDTSADARWHIFAGTLNAVAEFFPFGSGMGTYPEVFRRFQPADFSGIFVNHAHNDYLEWLVETGLVGGMLVTVFLGFYLLGWRRIWRQEGWNTLRFMQAGAGLGLLLLLLHGLVDFNLHIPANAIYFALLAAVYLHRPQERHPQNVRATVPEVAVAPEPPKPAPANIPNPFDD